MSDDREQRMILVDQESVRRVHVRPNLSAYLKTLWNRRFFIWADARAQALREGDNTFLGKLWVFINPLIQVIVYVVIFGLVLKTNRGIDNFVGFLVIGVIYFGFISTALNSGNGMVQGNKNMITSFNFPAASVVLSNALKNFLDNIAPAVVAVVIALLFQLHKIPSLALFLLVPAFLLMHLFMLGLTFIVARATAFIPDLKAIVSLVSRALFFLSGVFFPISRYVTDGSIVKLLELNPCYLYLSLFRGIVLDGNPGSLAQWSELIAWSLGFLILGLVFFWRAEERYASVK